MIDCAKARELVNQYIDNELNEADSSAYEEHISCCEACHEEYDMLRKIVADLSSVEVPLPEGFANRMHTVLAGEVLVETDRKEKKKFVFPYYRTASALAAALVIAIVGKYGIYDTYKNVVDDTARIATELSGEVPKIPETDAVKEDNTKEVRTAEPVIISAESSAAVAKVETESDVQQMSVVEDNSSLTDSVVVEQEIIPDTVDVETVPTETAVEAVEKTAEALPEKNAEDVEIPEKSYINIITEADEHNIKKSAAGIKREVISASQIQLKSVLKTPEKIDVAEKSGGIAKDGDAPPTDSGENAEPVYDGIALAKSRMLQSEDVMAYNDSEPVESIEGEAEITEMVPADVNETVDEAYIEPELSVISAEPIPAEISIYNNGDGSMMMFKKYLYTVVDGSRIADNGDSIVVTVTADEYADVMEHLSTNEYVKSVSPGIPVDGVAVINIR